MATKGSFKKRPRMDIGNGEKMHASLLNPFHRPFSPHGQQAPWALIARGRGRAIQTPSRQRLVVRKGGGGG